MKKTRLIITILLFTGIAMAQENSVTGSWVITNVVNEGESEEVNIQLDFIEGGSLEMMGTVIGKWSFAKKTNEMTIELDQFKELDGVSRVIKLKDNDMILDKGGMIINFLKQKNTEIERLNFSEEDFFDGEGNYKYEMEEDKLPWLNSFDMLTNLKEIKHLVYSYSTLIDGSNMFEKKNLTANVDVVEEEGTLNVDYIFYGFDSYNVPDDTVLPSNRIEFDYNSNMLYPYSEHDFRVVGYESITCPAGTFACTVLEVLDDQETMHKLWMIDKRAGVYARIIQDNQRNSGYYHIYELIEIQ